MDVVFRMLVAPIETSVTRTFLEVGLNVTCKCFLQEVLLR